MSVRQKIFAASIIIVIASISQAKKDNCKSVNTKRVEQLDKLNGQTLSGLNENAQCSVQVKVSETCGLPQYNVAVSSNVASNAEKQHLHQKYFTAGQTSVNLLAKQDGDVNVKGNVVYLDNVNSASERLANYEAMKLSFDQNGNLKEIKARKSANWLPDSENLDLSLPAEFLHCAF